MKFNPRYLLFLGLSSYGDVDCIQPIMDGSKNLRSGSVEEDGGAGAIVPEQTSACNGEVAATAAVLAAAQQLPYRSCLRAWFANGIEEFDPTKKFCEI